jgi:hypothetical protein
MPELKLNINDPTDSARPYLKQAQYLGINVCGPKKSRSHLVGGRGCSKTTSGIIKLIRAATEWMPGLPGLWTEPTHRLCHDTFFTEWKKIVPRDFYTINLSDMIVHCATGTDIYVRSRNVDNPQKEVAKGPNYAWGFCDEMAYKFDKQKWIDIDASIRLNTPYLFHDTLSTPKLNEYKDLVESDGHNYIHATSYDNPYLPDGWAEDMAAQMGQDYMEQEILGRWVALSGRIWKQWSNDPWPNGNIHDHEHDYDKPYLLAFDPGVASSAWLIIQQVQPYDEQGRLLWRHDPVWVVTAELMPKRDGSVDTILSEIKQHYGAPMRVVVGADVGTRASTDAKTPKWFITRHFGSIPIKPVTGWIADKEIQQIQLSYGILDTRGRRRFCVSKNLIQHYPETKRGILQVMEQDTWAAKDKDKDAMPKEGRLEHARDAAAYAGVGVMFPPKYGLYQQAAA